jgi:crotonobetainyl-CoA:carnitine CoA-transferase CaiB-like acyl-CoA transferase
VTKQSRDNDNGSERPESTDTESGAPETTRREAIQSIGAGTLGIALTPGMLPGEAAAKPASGGHGKLPFSSVRILERSRTLAGRLTGQLFADQGAEVFVDRTASSAPDALDDEYFDRGKIVLAHAAAADISSADVVILDGMSSFDRAPHQIVLRIVAALPGDEAYGHLPADCSEDLLNALVGFFTNMSITGPMLGRPVIYTPLPLCSVYAGVISAIATASALVDRERTGLGREVIGSRLAGGLSAIGALALTSTGLPDFLKPTDVGGLPEGMSPEQLQKVVAKAKASAAGQLWLEQRFAPLSAPFLASDGHFVLPMAAPNRRLTRWALQALGLWDKAAAAGMVDVSSYDAANIAYARRNLADSLALSFPLTSKIADGLQPVFAKRTATEWERYLTSRGVPCTRVRSWEDWQRDPDAHAARIFASVQGHSQIGRSAWVASAQPYPDLEAPRRADRLPPRSSASPAKTGTEPAHLPLAGFSAVDLTNVVAGPSCGRMLVELGATVYRVEPMAPNHSPTIVVTWAGELGGGKRSIIVDTETKEGRDILHRLVARADFVLANKLDKQMVRLGIDPDSLRRLNPAAIAIQISAIRGERRGPLHDDKGYDPSEQGTTGVMMRFGEEGAPTFHGIASCVDYLCGYLAVWAGVIALAARQHRRDKRGDWAETSLAAAATLTQLLLQKKKEPATARGQYATGMNASERVYKLSDGWIFAQGSHDLSAELGSQTVEQALAHLSASGINATPVLTCKQLADRHRQKPTKTVRFEKREKDGWVTECFAPTWFAFDGKPAARQAASRIGADATGVLTELGVKKPEMHRLVASGVVGRTEWAKG